MPNNEIIDVQIDLQIFLFSSTQRSELNLTPIIFNIVLGNKFINRCFEPCEKIFIHLSLPQILG